MVTHFSCVDVSEWLTVIKLETIIEYPSTHVCKHFMLHMFGIEAVLTAQRCSSFYCVHTHTNRL